VTSGALRLLCVLQQSFTFMGATVTIAASAREALATLADVDLVITDLDMPGEDGV
jgi:CheY-like chemotaxis protein